MPTVKVLFEDEYQCEITAETVGELKEELKEEVDHDVSKWNLFQFGLRLPDDGDAKLEDFLIEDEQLKLHLVMPEETERNGKSTQFKTDKTRFIVKGTRDAFDLIEIKASKKNSTIKLNKSNFLSKKHRFGIVTHIVNADKPGERNIQFDVYDVSKDGNVLIETDEDGNDEVFLVEPTTENREKLQSTDTKTYDEKDIITPLQRKKLRTGYTEALFTGITEATAVGSTALGAGGS